MKVRLPYYGTKNCKPTELFLNNKPDIINNDNKKLACVSIGVTIPRYRNVIKKKADYIIKMETS